MRSSIIVCATGLSLAALVLSCARSSEDDLGAGILDTAPPEAEENVKLPPPSQVDQDSGTTDSGRKKDSGTKDSGKTPPADSGGGGVGPACNTSDPFLLGYYAAQAILEVSPMPCPCPASKCCYVGLMCLVP